MVWLRFFLVVALVSLGGCLSQDSSNPTAVEPAASTTDGLGNKPAGAGVLANVTGSAHVQVFPGSGFGLRKLTFSAVQHADGNVTGEWNIVAGATILHGNIDCMTILPDGKSARISGIVENALFTTFLPGTAFAIQLEDNGNGGSGEPDSNSEVRAFRNAPPEVGHHFCVTGVAPVPVEQMAIEKGNVNIRVASDNGPS